ncbi:hypothetical protein SAMN04488137_4575 [Fictibacillus solisalsi]|uniref:YolD-like protein n=1 Tax=Fictibacillus solisalsi TaxID=459525 RepID=A0A1H0BMV0_9BACL|nr:hypothetical protein [Fictibacillus solisalsi]SDN46990.1 hypothetical protein SAMN04488137_4575 [Fictibacillus solisalsi]
MRFAPGTKVETNDSYYEMFKRRVKGEVINFNPLLDAVTMKWEHQEGIIIPEQQDEHVLMKTEDLQTQKQLMV